MKNRKLAITKDTSKKSSPRRKLFREPRGTLNHYEKNKSVKKALYSPKLKETRRERLTKVGAISKAQKAQNIIFGKTKIHFVAKYQISKKVKGDPLEEKF